MSSSDSVMEIVSTSFQGGWRDCAFTNLSGILTYFSHSLLSIQCSLTHIWRDVWCVKKSMACRSEHGSKSTEPFQVCPLYFLHPSQLQHKYPPCIDLQVTQTTNHVDNNVKTVAYPCCFVSKSARIS